MSIKDLNKELVITNLQTHDIKVIRDFFNYSHYTQESMLVDLVMPMLYDSENVNLSIGYKN